MDILLRQVLIIDPSSPFHQQKVDISIQNGFITEIGSLNKAAEKEISMEGLMVLPGFIDIFSNFCDPGFEYKETLETGAMAAAKGGYTDVFVVPNTSPAIHNKGSIEYIVQKSKSLPVSIHPIGAVTKNIEGKELSEMYDMFSSGAVAFSDGTRSLQSSGLLLKGLQYLKAIDSIIIQVPDDKNLSSHGLINEGIPSTQLGLPGKPAIAEEIMIARDIELVKYTGSKIHFTGISTARSLELITKAKKDGIEVTCSVTPYHLYFSEEDLYDYDTNLKVNPPLRTKEDVKALIDGVLYGSVDFIATHHFPEDADHKIVEFEYARYGMAGLETSFAVVKTLIPELPLERIVEIFSSKARNVFKLDIPEIKINHQASLTLILPTEKWTVGKSFSKSKNSAFIGKELFGKPIGIINKDSLILNE